MTCYHLSRWNGERKIEKSCDFCKKVFSAHISLDKKFCSKKCYSNYQKGLTGDKAVSWKGGRIRYGKNNAYWAIHQPHHPYADCKGYVMEHRLVMEKKIKRFLAPLEIVHHINNNSLFNEIDNLQIMSKVDHARLHAKRRHESHRTLS
jgi:hypothetical protein